MNMLSIFLRYVQDMSKICLAYAEYSLFQANSNLFWHMFSICLASISGGICRLSWLERLRSNHCDKSPLRLYGCSGK